MAITGSDQSSSSGYKTASAATMPYYSFPRIDTGTIDIPQDLLLDLANKKGLNVTAKTNAGVDSAIIDSLQQRITYLEQKGQVTKVKWRKGAAPKPIIMRDTIKVPVYYLATQVGNKEGPTGESISIYEVHKVDEICSKTTISSVEDTVEYHIKTSD